MQCKILFHFSLEHQQPLRKLLDPLQKLLNVGLQIDGEKMTAVAFEGLSVGTNKELLKVPGHIISPDRTPDDGLGVSHQRHRLVRGKGELFFQINKQRMSIASIHIHLFKKMKFWFKTISWTDVFQRS